MYSFGYFLISSLFLVSCTGAMPNKQSVGSQATHMKDQKSVHEKAQAKKNFSDIIPSIKNIPDDMWRIIVGYCGHNVFPKLWVNGFQIKYDLKTAQEFKKLNGTFLDRKEWYAVTPISSLSADLSRRKTMPLSKFSHDGNTRFVVYPHDKAQILEKKDEESEKSLHDFGGACFKKMQDVAFSFDSNDLAVVQGKDPILLWDTARGQLIGSIKHAKDLKAVGFSADGNTLFTLAADRETHQIWETSFTADKITVYQTLFIWLLDHYAQQAPQITLQAIAQAEELDMQELNGVFSSFSPERRQAIKRVYGLPDAVDKAITVGSSSSSVSNK